MNSTGNEVTAARRRINAVAMRLFALTGSTQLPVSELARAAGVARGTIYNQGAGVESLFEEVANELAADMNERLLRSCGAMKDPAERVAAGTRQYVRMAHEHPDWGRFVVRFTFTSRALDRLWAGAPGRDLRAGIRSGRFTLRGTQTQAAMGLMAGGVLVAMASVLEGRVTWRAAGSDAAELLLLALGIGHQEARAIAFAPLPALQPSH